MMAVGKTTLGKLVAKEQGMKFIDTDLCVEKRCSMKISEIFKKKGEKFFRLEEKLETLKFLKKDNCVIALGGGAFVDKVIRNNILKNALSVWLDVNLITLNKRIKWNKKRPLLDLKNTQKKLNELYYDRKAIYKLANYKINCDNLNKNIIVKKIINFYENN